jgi:hypothetical protein
MTMPGLEGLHVAAMNKNALINLIPADRRDVSGNSWLPLISLTVKCSEAGSLP